MASSVDKLIEGMPTPTVTKIIGSPDYESLKVVNDELTANGYSVQTNLGCGTVGYARLTLQPATYATISIAAWIPPPNPGTQAIIPANTTANQITRLNREFDTATTIYATYRLVGNALKKQLLAAVDDIFICSLKAPYIGYGNVTVLDLLTHLFATYAQISPGDLANNESRMTKDYDPNLPIETLFLQIEEAVAYADHGNDPTPAVTVTNRAYNLVFKTGIFLDDCRDWKRLPAIQKTWIEFKTFFARAHQEWRETQATTAAAQFGANNMEDTATATANAISNLSAATAADKATMVSLTAAVQTLTAQLATAHSQLASTQGQLITALSNKPSGGGNGRSGRDRKPNPYGPNRHYCYTCGFDCDHSSANHPNKPPGHKDNVSRYNTKGGSQANKKE